MAKAFDDMTEKQARAILYAVPAADKPDTCADCGRIDCRWDPVTPHGEKMLCGFCAGDALTPTTPNWENSEIAQLVK